jgi:F0F1-type ATP synthase membrane subunit b/b'
MASRDKALQDVAAMAADIAAQIVQQLTGAKVTKAAASAAVSKTFGK